MSKLVVENTTAQWHELVREAESLGGISLDEETESYLVFLLMRYTACTELAAKVLALEYLTGAQTAGTERQERMRDVGDQCLLFSGLFPRRAERRRVRVSYYVNLGRSAYENVADATQTAMGKMFRNLSSSFVSMMDTLLAMRSLAADAEVLEPLAAYELWSDTDSRWAHRLLVERNQAIPVRIKSSRH